MQPLSGLVVLDFTTLLPGPLAGGGEVGGEERVGELCGEHRLGHDLTLALERARRPSGFDLRVRLEQLPSGAIGDVS